MADILYNISIYPFEFLIEIVYFIFRRNDLGVRIILIGIIINIIALPLYNIADKLQKKESDLQAKFKSKIDEIKAVFSGDKRQMLIQSYYRIHNYHPIYSLRGLLGLLIQVPIFIAAYHFISNLTDINGRSFGIIKNLAKPDSLITLGTTFSINLLPIIMTVLNVLSSLLHTRGKTNKDRIPLFIMAGLFLVLLYNSPSALLVYWTTTNLFSLIKNTFIFLKKETDNFNVAKIVKIFGCYLNILRYRFIKIGNHRVIKSNKTRNVLDNFAKKLASICRSVGYALSKLDKSKITKYVGIFLFVFIVIYYALIHLGLFYAKPDTIIIVNALFILSLLVLLVKILPFNKIVVTSKKYGDIIFISSSFLIAILLALFIPSSLIASSPDEFSNTWHLIIITFIRMFSLMFIYPLLFYFTFSKKTQNKLIVLSSFIAIYALFNTFLFTGEYGTLNKDFMFDFSDKLIASLKENIINISVGVVVFIVLLIVMCMRKYVLINNIMILSSIALLFISIKNLYDIDKAQAFKQKMSEVNNTISSNSLESTSPIKKKPRIINLSKDGENVFVFFMDRATPYYLALTLENLPELADELDGFVWYEKTISLSTGTLASIFPLFGGYDYTPLQIMKRSKDSLREKYNEATLVIPNIFTSNGYNSTIIYPPIAGWYWSSDVSIFKPYTNIKAYRKAFNIDEYITDYITITNDYMDIYLMNFSLFRSLPMCFRYSIYNDGNWGAPKNRTYLNEGFKEYLYLIELTNLINITSNENTYTFFGSDMTHEPQYFNIDYTASQKHRNVSQREREKYGNDWLAKQAYANGAMLIELRNFVNYLKENNIYDNTKIILVSDHGGPIPVNSIFGFKGTNIFSRELGEINHFNSLLLVKDFNSRGKISTNTNFMVTADIPMIVTSHLKTTLKNYNKYESKESNLYTFIIKSRISQQYKNTFNIDAVFSIKSNAFNTNNWREITNYKGLITND